MHLIHYTLLVTGALLVVTTPACSNGSDDDASAAGADARLNSALQEIEGLRQALASMAERVTAVESDLAAARLELSRLQDEVYPLPYYVRRSAAIAEHYVATSSVVSAQGAVLGVVVAHHDDALEFVDYSGRVVVVSLTLGGDVPFYGDLFFAEAGCGGDAYVQHGEDRVWGSNRPGALDWASGAVFEDDGGENHGVWPVRSRKNWSEEGCHDLADGATVVGFNATRRAITAAFRSVVVKPLRAGVDFPRVEVPLEGL